MLQNNKKNVTIRVIVNDTLHWANYYLFWSWINQHKCSFYSVYNTVIYDIRCLK